MEQALMILQISQHMIYQVKIKIPEKPLNRQMLEKESIPIYIELNQNTDTHVEQSR